MKKTYQLLEARVLMNPRTDICIDNYINLWASRNYGPLGVLLAGLRALYFTHQQNHWTCRGANFYGDHLLFQRLYEKIADEIDTVAEKCVGVGDESTVDLQFQLKTVFQMLKDSSTSSVTVGSSDYAKKSLSAEYTFLNLCDVVRSTLDAQGKLSIGIDNMIAGIMDVHESHVFLLKQQG